MQIKTDKPYYGILQAFEVVQPDSKYDLEVFGQYYKIPSSGKSPLIESCGTRYFYDYGKKEIVLVGLDNKEFFRKQVDPEIFAKSEYKWLKIAKEEARVMLGIDDIY